MFEDIFDKLRKQKKLINEKSDKEEAEIKDLDIKDDKRYNRYILELSRDYENKVNKSKEKSGLKLELNSNVPKSDKEIISNNSTPISGFLAEDIERYMSELSREFENKFNDTKIDQNDIYKTQNDKKENESSNINEMSKENLNDKENDNKDKEKPNIEKETSKSQNEKKDILPQTVEIDKANINENNQNSSQKNEETRNDKKDGTESNKELKEDTSIKEKNQNTSEDTNTNKENQNDNKTNTDKTSEESGSDNNNGQNGGQNNNFGIEGKREQKDKANQNKGQKNQSETKDQNNSVNQDNNKNQVVSSQIENGAETEGQDGGKNQNENKNIMSQENKQEGSQNSNNQENKNDNDSGEGGNSDNKENNTADDNKDKDTITFANVKNVLGKSNDFRYKTIMVGGNPNNIAMLTFIDGVINSELVSDYIMKPLVTLPVFMKAQNCEEVIQAAENGAIYFPNATKREKLVEVLNALVRGEAALIFDNAKAAITFDVKGFEKRSISEPTFENVKKGARDVFIEEFRVNTATVRKRIKNANLVIEETIIGKQTQTPVAIIFIDGLTNKKLIEEVKKRLAKIQVDNALTTAFIEEFIIDKISSPFPQIATTERPDKFCANIVEGRVGLLIDGIPLAYIIPGTLLQFIQAPEDYAQHFIVGSILRVLRFILMLITLFLPGFYISVATFHQEMIPTELALSIASAKQGVPFPTFVEVLIMLMSFEILLEAGLRLPKNIGSAVSIVGGIIVGQAAVEARFISPAVVVVIALTAIADFAMTNQDFSYALRLTRFLIAIISSVFGLFGLSIGALLLLYHLSTIVSFGVPYLAAFTNDEGQKIIDTVVSFPVKFFKKRPIELNTENKTRQK